MSVINKKVGIITAIERIPGSKVICQCDCGNRRTVLVGHFNAGYVKSCGCHVVRHGHAGKQKTREYISYYNLIERCHNESNKRFHDYGGIGITVCERWRNSFVEFIEDMGLCPQGMQIDRVDNTKGYSPDNCRWATRKQNQRNMKKSKIWIVNGAKYESLAEAAEVEGVSGATIQGWCKGRIMQGRVYDPRPECGWEWKYQQTAGI